MHNPLRKAALSLAATMLFALAATSAMAETVIQVTLRDAGGDMSTATGLIYGAPDLDRSKATMFVDLSADTAPAGAVTFDVTNVSKDTIHELVVISITDPAAELPYNVNEEKVDEDSTVHKGEVAELDPGKAGSLTLDLAPGKYLLICNIPGHYTAGMWAEFTVTP